VTAMSDALDIYLHVREKEGRLYSDEIVRATSSVAGESSSETAL
jgi:hypothetical protein